MADSLRNHGTAAGHSPHEDPPPWRARLLLALTFLVLLALVLIPVLVHGRAQALQQRATDLHEPSFELTVAIERSLAQGMSALRGYLLSGDPSFLDRYQAARVIERRAYAGLQPLVRRIGPEAVEALQRLQERTTQWHKHVTTSGVLTRGAVGAEYLRAIELEQRIFEDAFTEAGRLSKVIQHAEQALWVELQRTGSVQTVVTSLLVLLALVAIVAVGRIGRRVRLLAARLGERVSQERAFRVFARELAAATTPDEVHELAARAAHALTVSRGAFSGRILPDGKDVEVRGTAGEGVPARGARIPYPDSIVDHGVQTHEPVFRSRARNGDGPAVSVLAQTCPDCSVLVLPLLAERDALGCMVLLRAPDQPVYTGEEIGRLRIVADFAALALRRAVLLEEAERRRREVELSEDRYRSLFMHDLDSIYELDLEGRCLALNPASTRIFGYSEEDVIGKIRLDLIEGGNREHVLEQFRRALEGEPQQYEATARRKGGGLLEIRGTLVPIVVAGRVSGVFAISEDVTERRRVERSNARLLAILEATTDFIGTADCDGRTLYVNPAGRRMLGIPSDEDLRGVPISVFAPESAHEVIRRDALPTAAETGSWSGESFLLHRDGREIPVSKVVIGHRSPDGELQYFSSIMRDVSERKAAEDELRRTTETLRTLIAASPLATIVFSTDGLVRLWNPAAERVLGWAEEEVIGERLPFIPADRWHEFERLVQRVLTLGTVTGTEVRYVRKDGTPVDLGVSAAPLPEPGGQGRRVVGIFEDISERKRAEAERRRLLEREQAAHTEAERRSEQVTRLMESKARLIRGFSHDLKNPLGAVIGYADLLTAGVRGELSETQRESVDRIRTAAHTMLTLIEDLVELSRAEAGELRIEQERLDPGTVVRAATEQHRAEAEAAGHALVLDVPDGLPETLIDPKRVRQILGNLLSNAIKYTPQGGRISVRAEIRTDGATGTARWLAVEVSDTGPGIPKEKQHMLFQEFSRLGKDGKGGAGLGLAISRRIARLLGGEITVESEVGRGSTFTLWLPMNGQREDELAA